MLSFANPSALWLLLLIIPLILLYLLRRKRTELVVPSVLLWKLAVEDSRAQTPFQKLRSNLLLLLQILIVVLVTAALSEPHLASSYQQSQRWIIVIDSSASMQSSDVKPNRFLQARAELLKLIASLPAPDEIMLIALSSEASILQSFSAQHSLIRSKLESLKPEDLAEDWQQLRLLLDPLLKENPRPRIVIASDFANMPEDIRQGFSFNAVAFGRSNDNVGIIHAVLRGLPENSEVQELFYQIKNWSGIQKNLQVELKMDDSTIDAYDTPLGSGQTLERSVRVSITTPSKVTIQVRPSDFLSLDNDFVIQAEPRKRIPVQVAGANPFVQNALKVIPTVTVTSSAAIVVGTITQTDQAGIFFTSTKSKGCTGAIVDWNASHPSLRFVNAGLWQLSSCALLTPTESTETLLETEQGPVGYAEHLGKKRRVVLGFLPEQSNIVLLAGFPIFLQNTIEWISEELQPNLPSLTGGQFRYEGPIELYEQTGYVNFENERESNIAPSMPKTGSIVSRNLVQIRRDVSFWFLILLTTVVMLEWYVFHRRIEI